MENDWLKVTGAWIAIILLWILGVAFTVWGLMSLVLIFTLTPLFILSVVFSAVLGVLAVRVALLLYEYVEYA